MPRAPPTRGRCCLRPFPFPTSQIAQVKLAFNADFERLAAQKRSDCDKVADLNARLEDALKDMRKIGVGE